MNIQNSPQGQQTIQGFINQVPFGIKLLTIITLIVFFINALFDGFFTNYFIDTPIKVFQNFQLWRLFFTQFIENLFGAILMPIFICMSLSDLEKTLGTVVFILDFFFKSFMIQVIYLILSLIIQNNNLPSRGLWNVYLVYLSLQCFANPNQLRSFFFFPCVLPAKIIPFLLVLMGVFMSQSFDPIAALILAYIEANYFNFMIFRPSQQLIQKLENGFLFRNVKSRSDFFVMTQNLQGRPQNQADLPVQHVEEYQEKGIQIGSSLGFDNIETNNKQTFQQFSNQSQQDNSK
ncbi:unnamed protein product (macronuclear) [Paramecium tetraurelia]|uniref:Derlin n=1 Tax=Paramecium tetraurelia TaxID=5888 RepID=A0C6V1_PARTE|nr:uncharacterized protein GSPATT00035647001 [Paramecium tetraurelia]CAK66518.1 unnamed protein product [Paramecium tetraurelia]|eukprot:XP_001433915.1 hypothetical protein (macronuclear) [Paramecium tetraurelia strain d4-2]